MTTGSADVYPPSAPLIRKVHCLAPPRYGGFIPAKPYKPSNDERNAIRNPRRNSAVCLERLRRPFAEALEIVACEVAQVIETPTTCDA